MPSLTTVLGQLSTQKTGAFGGRVSLIGRESYVTANGRVVRVDQTGLVSLNPGDRVTTAVTPEGISVLTSQSGAYQSIGPERVLIDG